MNEPRDPSAPAQEPQWVDISVDEEVAHFLKLKEREGVSPNSALRFLIFGENPYIDPEQFEKFQRQIEESSRVSTTEPDSLREARERHGR